MERRIKVTFRRHYASNVDDIVNHDLKVQEDLRSTQDMNESKVCEVDLFPSSFSSSFPIHNL